MNHDMAVLIDCMNQHNGLLPYTDKSDSKLIKLNLRMSKSAFKRAVGHLLKTNQIIMTEGKIRLKDNKKDVPATIRRYISFLVINRWQSIMPV